MDWRVAVRFEHRLAQTFEKERIGLAGDAAHLAGPIGVQSMNCGLAEADDLAELVAEMLDKDAPNPSLESYGRRSTRAMAARLDRMLVSAATKRRTLGSAKKWIAFYPACPLPATTSC